MRDKLIKRLTEYYKLERFHALWISVFGVFLNLKFGWRSSLLLTYGIALVVLVLVQGTYYWERKLATVQGGNLNPHRVLQQFHRFKWVNVCVIVAYPVLIVLMAAQFNDLWTSQTHIGWALFAYGFAVAEHVNYYHIQLMYDNHNDWQYLRIYKRLKIASLRKDFKKTAL